MSSNLVTCYDEEDYERILKILRSRRETGTVSEIQRTSQEIATLLHLGYTVSDITKPVRFTLNDSPLPPQLPQDAESSAIELAKFMLNNAPEVSAVKENQLDHITWVLTVGAILMMLIVIETSPTLPVIMFSVFLTGWFISYIWRHP